MYLENKSKILQRERGITLIALVVTIIVLLILAGVAINLSVGENGIFKRAQDASKLAEKSSLEEKIKLAILSAEMNNDGNPKIDIKELQSELDKVFKNGILKEYSNNNEFIYYANGTEYKISSAEVVELDFKDSINKKQENRNIKGEYNYSYNNPIIPSGFIPLETAEASWKTDENGIPTGWNDGLVIMDESGNEFVWIPCTTNAAGQNEGIVQYGSYANDSKFTNYQVDINSLYDIQQYIPVENQLSQIEKYQGFYVGRYETGISENIEKVSDIDISDRNDVVNINNVEPQYNGITVKPVIQQGKELWNCVNRDNAAKISRKIVDNEYVKSGLITGKQWDTMLEWIITKGTYDNSDEAEKYYANLGNFYNSEYTINGLYAKKDKNRILNWNQGQFTKNISEEAYLGTGVHNNSLVNNIYDIYGNVWEITTETDNDGKMIQRGIGGNAGANKAAGVHRHGNDDTSGPEIGFRIVLYIL